MMAYWIFIAFVAASLVSVFKYFLKIIPNLNWIAPFCIIATAGLSIFFNQYLSKRIEKANQYLGFGDLVFQIVDVSNTERSFVWWVRSFFSFILGLFTGGVGPEGAVFECIKAIKLRKLTSSFNWFENMRRTDLSSNLAVGISVAFGAPFAGILFPVELGLGGPVLLSAVGALFGSFFIHTYSNIFQLPIFSIEKNATQIDLFQIQTWAGILSTAVLVSFIGMGLIQIYRYFRTSLDHLFQSHIWTRTFMGCILLVAVYFVHPDFHFDCISFLDKTFKHQFSLHQIGLFAILLSLSLGLILCTFGTSGILWPLFTLGGAFGVLIQGGLLGFAWDTHFFDSNVLGLVGASAMWGVVLGTPFSAAVLVCEVSGNFQLFLPCLIASWIAMKFGSFFKIKTIWESDLAYRGEEFKEGRSVSILNSLKVQELMILDHKTGKDNESILELQSKFLQSRYPFIPIVDNKENYQGMITLDMLKTDWNLGHSHENNSALDQLITVKDLLKKYSFKFPTIRESDQLSKIIHLFNLSPCLPVLDQNGRILGLLLIYHVRLGYERERMKKSIIRTPIRSFS